MYNFSNKKILIEMHHGIGDSVFLIPTLQYINKQYPTARLYLILHSYSREQVVKMAGVRYERIYFCGSLSPQNISQYIQLIWDLVRTEFDVGILSPQSSITLGKLLLLIANVQHKLGEQYKGSLYVKQCAEIHRIKRYLDVVGPLEYSSEELQPQLQPSFNTIEWAKKELAIFNGRKIIGLCIGSGSYKYRKYFKTYAVSFKSLSNKKLIEIIRAMLRNGFVVCLFGGAQEKEFCAEHADLIYHPSIYNAVDNTDIEQSAALAKICDLVVACDTGMLYIADAVGSKTLGIFGPTAPIWSMPFSNRFSLLSNRDHCLADKGTSNCVKCENRICINSITATEIIEKIFYIVG